MKFISMWYKKILLILLISFVLPNFAFAQNCAINGYTIATVNGIFTNETEARKNKDALKQLLSTNFKGEKVNIDFLYNPTHGGGLGDLIDYVKQGLFNQKSDYDMTEILQDASSKIKTQKLLLVAHSQGNFYSNNFYEKVADMEGGIPVKSIGVYGVANPSGTVAGGGKYITSSTDKVINKVVSTLDHNVLPSNTDIVLSQGDDPFGHSFTDIYLKYRSDRIVKEIKESLDKLKSNDVQNENMPCINPPKITLGHKIQKSVLAITDPFVGATIYVLGGVYNTAAIVRDVGSDAVAWVFNTSKSIANSVFKFTKSNLASVADSISENDNNFKTNVGDLDLGGNNQNENKNVSITNTDVLNTVDTPIELNDGITINDNLNDKNDPDTMLHNSGGGGGGNSALNQEIINDENNTNETIDSVTKEDVIVDEADPVVEETTEEEKPIDAPEITEPIVQGNKINFDSQDKIYYSGNFMLCDIDNHTIHANGNNSSMNFISSTNWQTPYMKTVNGNMPTNKNYRFIFGDNEQSLSDCTNNTFINDYSNTFYYATSMGDSIVYDEDTLNRILSFKFNSLGNSQVIMHDNGVNKISVYVSNGTDLTNLIPTISISDKATIYPQSEVASDYTNPVVYKVTAFDGSIQEYTVTVYSTLGKKIDFDINNKISYFGKFIFCDIDTSSVHANGEVGGFISSTNWQTPYMKTVNDNMIPNKNYRFIFGSYNNSDPDCKNNTFVSNYSQTFYYASSLGSSVVYGVYTTPVEPDPIVEPDPVIEPDPTVDPDPVIDPVLDPDPNLKEDPDPTPIPDTTPPSIENYTFNDTTGNITVNPVENPMTFTLTASENVDWVSMRIEKQDDDNVYKTFFSGNDCVDFTNTCTKTWSDTSKGLLSSGVYRIKVNIKDTAGNIYQDYLEPYVINVDMTLPKN